MSDCHVDTYRDAGDGRYRAQAVHTPTGAVLFTTWPYTHEGSARARAWRWVAQELEKADAPGLFATAYAENQQG